MYTKIERQTRVYKKERHARDLVNIDTFVTSTGSAEVRWICPQRERQIYVYKKRRTQQIDWLSRETCRATAVLRDAIYINTLQYTFVVTEYRAKMPINTATNTGKHKMNTARCNTLQHTATHCNTLPHTATHCSTLQHTATHIYCTWVPRLNADTHCNKHWKTKKWTQHAATHCNTLQHTATHICCTWAPRAVDVELQDEMNTTRCNPRQRAATHCSNALQHTFVVPERHLPWMSNCKMKWTQNTATHCNTLQHTTAHCNALQHTFVVPERHLPWMSNCKMKCLQQPRMSNKSKLNTLQHRYRTPQHAYHVLQCIAVCCSVL